MGIMYLFHMHIVREQRQAPQMNVLNQKRSRRRPASTLVGRAAVSLSEQLLSDCVYLFTVSHGDIAKHGLGALVDIQQSPSFEALERKTFALQFVRTVCDCFALVAAARDCFGCTFERIPVFCYRCAHCAVHAIVFARNNGLLCACWFQSEHAACDLHRCALK